MKKKIVTILIIAIITTLGLFGFWSKNYLTALWYFKSDNTERHRLAFDYLKEIPGSVTIELYKRLGDELQKEVYTDYQNRKREELINQYSNTLIAYIDDENNICIRSFDGKKKKVFTLNDGYSSFKIVKWSDDGTRLAISGNLRSLYLTDLFGKDVKVISRDETITKPDWSFDNKNIMVSNLAAINVYNISSGEINKLYRAQLWENDGSDGKYSPFYPIWLDDKNILVSIKNNLEIINSETKERKIIHTNKDVNKFTMDSLTSENYTFGMKALSYSGKLVAMEGGSILNINDTSIVKRGFNDFPTWAPDDKYIMSYYSEVQSINPKGIHIGAVNEEEILYNIKIYMGPGRAPAWSPPLDNYDEIIAQMDDNEIDYNFELKEPLFR